MRSSKPLTLCAIGCLILVVAVAILWLRMPSVPIAKLPTPNAYEELVQVGEQVTTPSVGITEASLDELTAFVAANEHLLAPLQEAIQHDSCVPITYEAGFLEKEIERMGSLRQAARLLQAQARLAELQDRHAEAAEFYMQLVILSRKLSRGGLSVHLLLGIAYERTGWTALQRLVPSLDADTKIRVAKALDALENQQEELAAYSQREQALSRATNGWLITKLHGRQLNRLADPAYKKTAELREEMSKIREDLRRKTAE